MTDEDKIEAAAQAHATSEGCNGAADKSFEDGVAWRDANPGPHVMALVSALAFYKCKMHIGKPVPRTIDREVYAGGSLELEVKFHIPYEDGSIAKIALAQFEKAVKE